MTSTRYMQQNISAQTTLLLVHLFCIPVQLCHSPPPPHPLHPTIQYGVNKHIMSLLLPSLVVWDPPSVYQSPHYSCLSTFGQINFFTKSVCRQTCMPDRWWEKRSIVSGRKWVYVPELKAYLGFFLYGTLKVGLTTLVKAKKGDIVALWRMPTVSLPHWYARASLLQGPPHIDAITLTHYTLH